MKLGLLDTQTRIITLNSLQKLIAHVLLIGNEPIDDQAKQFETVLQEFIVYTHNKKTIFKELENLGWAVNKRKRRVISPDFEDMLTDNEHFNQLFKSKNLVRDSSNVNFQLA